MSKIQRFRFYCQKILPLVYDDSLSYYEVLCKIGYKLDEVINVVNDIDSTISEAIKQYFVSEEFKEFFDNFMVKVEDSISTNNEGYNNNSLHEYNVGDYLWWKGYFYEVTKYISAGSLLLPNENIKLVSLSDLFEVFTDSIKTLFSKNIEDSATSSRPRSVGEWIWRNDNLYIVTSYIDAGTAYIESGDYANIAPLGSLEEIIGNMKTLGTIGKDSLVMAINECVNAINVAISEIGDLSSLGTQGKDSLVQAINEVINSYNYLYNDVQTVVKPAIDQIRVDIGNKNNLQTEHKDNLVDAINELTSTAGNDTFDQSREIHKAIFFGDSITAGDLGNGVIANPTYPQSYGSVSGLQTTNMGRGGSTAANTPNAGSAEHLNYVAGLVNFAEYDQCFVCHGVNDYNANSPLGGINSTDETTYMGALQKFVETALAQNPKIQIVILGTFWSSHSHVVNNQFVDYLPANKAGYTIADYTNGARSVANKYGIPFVNMMDIMGVNRFNYGQFTADGIHPTQDSYTRIGILLAKSLTFPSAYGYEQTTAVKKSCNNNMVCIGDIDQKVGDFPLRYLKRGITTLFNVNNSYYITNRRPFTIVKGEPLSFHAIAYVTPHANFYIRLTMSGTSNTCVLWYYQNVTEENQCFEVNTVATPTFTGDCVIEAQIASLDGTLTDEIVYLTDIVINKGEIPDRGGLGTYTNEYTWFIIPSLSSGVTLNNANPAQFMIDRNGQVTFRGVLDLSATLSTNVLGTLPIAFRPQRPVVMPVSDGATLTPYAIKVTEDGNIIILANGIPATGVSIDMSNVKYNINKCSDFSYPY